MMSRFSSTLLLFLVFATANLGVLSFRIVDNGVEEDETLQNTSATPIVLWHGMGDSCCFPFSIGGVANQLRKAIPGVYVHSLEIGDNIVDDMANGYLLHPDRQIEIACEKVGADENLVNGFNAIGFSQGGQFLRGLLQRCPEAKIRNLITLGAQHQGVYGLPNCGSLSGNLCDEIRRLLNHAAYAPWVQEELTQATYWHDPLNETEYKYGSTYLADINNELVINQTYIERLQSLENLVLVRFENDTMVQPVASSWFGFYKPGQSDEVQNLDETDLYKEDRLGLKSLNEANKVHFISTPGNHLKFKWDWFIAEILTPFLL